MDLRSGRVVLVSGPLGCRRVASEPGSGARRLRAMEQPRPVDDRRLVLEALYAAHARVILAYALRRLPIVADAEEAAAETFVVAWRRLRDRPATNDALPWLYAIARRVVANQHRAAERRDRLRARVRDQAVSELAAGPEADSLVMDVLMEMRTDDQELLRLVAWEGLRHAEIAVVLGISPNAVAIRLHRARTRFERVLAKRRPIDVKGSGPSRTSTRAKGRLLDRLRRERSE